MGLYFQRHKTIIFLQLGNTDTDSVNDMMNNLANIYLNEEEMVLQGDCEIVSVFDSDVETKTESEIAGLIDSKNNNLIEGKMNSIINTQTHRGNSTLPLIEF